MAGENQIENEKKRGKKMFVRGTVGHVTTCRALGGGSVIRKNTGQTFGTHQTNVSVMLSNAQ